MAPVIRANSLYTIVYGPSWDDAQAYSQTLGGNLASITSAEENEFIRSSFESADIGLKPDVYLIGLYRDNPVSGWKWVNGESVTYLNWGRKEPWNGRLYGAMNTYYEGEKTGDYWGADPGSWSDGYGQETSDRYGIAEIPLILSVTHSGTPTEGAGVFTSSINLSAGTATSIANGATVYWTASGITSDDLASGSLTGSGTISGGKLDIQHSLVSDLDTGENFQVSVFSDSARTLQIGTTSSIGIQEAPVPEESGGSSSTTPATPATPATPVTAATPATPATPVTAATPATPATPVTAATPATPVTPATPAPPEDPGTPATTADPGTPAVPASPATPVPSQASPVLGIQPQETVTTVQLTKPLILGTIQVIQAVIGTPQNDVITGTDVGEVLAGGSGKNQMSGGGGPDAFLFETPGEFGKKSLDIVTDFNPGEGDKLAISKEAYGGVTKVKLKVANGKKDAKNAASSNKTFIYDEKSGVLYFNENGKKDGFGDGGEFVKLLGAPEIGKGDFAIV